MNKKIIVFPLIGMSVLLMALTCTKDRDDRHYHIDLKNNTNTIIWVDDRDTYPDTSIKDGMYYRDIRGNCGSCIMPHENSGEALWTRSSYESTFHKRVYENGYTYGYDTLIVFVFNDDTLAKYDWQYIDDHYLVQQRYDVSLDDLKRLNWQLYFPPKESMRDIKMWPPYGTYDENGNRVVQE